MGYYFDWCSWRAPLQDGSIDVCGMRLQSGNGDALIDDVFEFAVAAATPPIDAMCQARGSRHVSLLATSRRHGQPESWARAIRVGQAGGLRDFFLALVKNGKDGAALSSIFLLPILQRFEREMIGVAGFVLSAAARSRGLVSRARFHLPAAFAGHRASAAHISARQGRQGRQAFFKALGARRVWAV